MKSSRTHPYTTLEMSIHYHFSCLELIFSNVHLKLKILINLFEYCLCNTNSFCAFVNNRTIHALAY